MEQRNRLTSALGVGFRIMEIPNPIRVKAHSLSATCWKHRNKKIEKKVEARRDKTRYESQESKRPLDPEIEMMPNGSSQLLLTLFPTPRVLLMDAL